MKRLSNEERDSLIVAKFGAFKVLKTEDHDNEYVIDGKTYTVCNKLEAIECVFSMCCSEDDKLKEAVHFDKDNISYYQTWHDEKDYNENTLYYREM